MASNRAEKRMIEDAFRAFLTKARREMASRPFATRLARFIEQQSEMNAELNDSHRWARFVRYPYKSNSYGCIRVELTRGQIPCEDGELTISLLIPIESHR